MTIGEGTAWQIAVTLFAAGGLYVKLLAMNGDLKEFKVWKKWANDKIVELLTRSEIREEDR